MFVSNSIKRTQRSQELSRQFLTAWCSQNGRSLTIPDLFDRASEGYIPIGASFATSRIGISQDQSQYIGWELSKAFLTYVIFKLLNFAPHSWLAYDSFGCCNERQ